jgi:integrase
MSVSARPRHPITGRRFILTARTPRELETYLQRITSLRTEMRIGLRTVEEVDRELRHLRHGPAVLERAAVSYLERPNLARNTKKRVRSLIDPAKSGHMAPLLSKPIAALDAPTLAAWISDLERAGLHGTSIGTVWRTLRAIVRHASEKGWIGALPWGAWRPKLRGAAKRPLREAARSYDELAALLAAAAELDAMRGPLSCLQAAIACAALLGLRQGELAGLRWTDVETLGLVTTVLVARQWEGQPLKMGAAPMRVESGPELGQILAAHAMRLTDARRFAPKGPVFPHPKHAKPTPYTRGQVLSTLNLRACVRRAKLPHVVSWSPHSLRDSFVTLEAIAAAGDLRRVAARSRHATIDSLARYLRTHTRNPAPPSLLTTLQGRNEGDAAPIDDPT